MVNLFKFPILSGSVVNPESTFLKYNLVKLVNSPILSGNDVKLLNDKFNTDKLVNSPILSGNDVKLLPDNLNSDKLVNSPILSGNIVNPMLSISKIVIFSKKIFIIDLLKIILSKLRIIAEISVV